jgi:DinB superfamily
MSTETAAAPVAEAAESVDTALGRLIEGVSRIGDGDLHRAHRDGGWSVAQVISHINVCTLIWLGNIHRLPGDPELRFFFREEIGHDALGYPPPTVDVALRQLSSTRKTLATTVASTDPAVLARTVEIPDLGTTTINEWTPLIIGHLSSHVDQVFEIMRDREFAPEGI